MLSNFELRAFVISVSLEEVIYILLHVILKVKQVCLKPKYYTEGILQVNTIKRDLVDYLLIVIKNKTLMTHAKCLNYVVEL